MSIRQLAQQQYQHYQLYHGERNNLWLHLLTVPLFQLGCVLGVIGLCTASLWLISAWLMLPLSLALQGIGHQRENNSPQPFSSPLNFVQRIVLEQFYSFPRFLLSGAWWRALTNISAKPRH